MTPNFVSARKSYPNACKWRKAFEKRLKAFLVGLDSIIPKTAFFYYFYNLGEGEPWSNW